VKKRTAKFIAVGSLFVGAVTIPYIVHRVGQSRIDGQHIFEVAAQPRFLTEELALTKARETLKREGCSPGDWQPQLARITTASDGRTDEFMSRDTALQIEVSFISGPRAVMREMFGWNSRATGWFVILGRRSEKVSDHVAERLLQ
jgi:hypothetical protein